ncbi:hypothetical protein [Bradyrhizobium liaoningense]
MFDLEHLKRLEHWKPWAPLHNRMMSPPSARRQLRRRKEVDARLAERGAHGDLVEPVAESNMFDVFHLTSAKPI